MSTPETRQRGLVLILVEQMDRRLAPAMALALALPDVEVRAIHICTDPVATEELARAWMDHDLAEVPLHIEDAGAEDLPTRIGEVVARQSDGRSRVIVVLPEVDLDHWWQPLLHRSNARRIARGLQRMRQVSTVIVPYPAFL